MRNSAYEARNGRVPNLVDVLQHPVVTNLVRLSLIVIFSLAGYIWKTEMDHVNRSLEDIEAGVRVSIDRQWGEINGVRLEVSRMNGDVYRILNRTNTLLYELVRPPDGDGRRPAVQGKPSR